MSAARPGPISADAKADAEAAQAGYSCHLIGRQPVVVRRRVKWGECDPAGVVYTPRFADYVAEAFHLFLESLLGGRLQSKYREFDFATPAKALNLEFKRSLWPDQVFDMTVRVTDIRNRTFVLDIRATDDQPGEIFAAELTGICVWFEKRESRPIPDALRQRLEAYRAACGGPR